MLKANATMLGKAAAMATNILPPKTPKRHSILSKVLLAANAENQTLSVTASDMDNFLTIEIPAKVTSSFRATPLASLLTPLRTYPQDVEVELLQDCQFLFLREPSVEYPIADMVAQEDYPEPPAPPERVIWHREIVWSPSIAIRFRAIMSKKYNLKRHNVKLDGVNLETLNTGGLTMWITNGFVLGRSLCSPSPGCPIGDGEQRLFVEWRAFEAFASAIHELHKALHQPLDTMPTVAVTTWKDKQSPALLIGPVWY
jgi:hypothetical protein